MYKAESQICPEKTLFQMRTKPFVNPGNEYTAFTYFHKIRIQEEHPLKRMMMVARLYSVNFEEEENLTLLPTAPFRTSSLQLLKRSRSLNRIRILTQPRKQVTGKL